MWKKTKPVKERILEIAKEAIEKNPKLWEDSLTEEGKLDRTFAKTIILSYGLLFNIDTGVFE